MNAHSDKEKKQDALALKVDGKLIDLSSLSSGESMEYLTFKEPEGKEVFWHTSAHVLAQAILRLFPEAIPTIGPAIEQGFYYDFANLHISEADFEKIENEVEKILRENYKPKREEISTKSEALKLFHSNPYKCEIIEGFEEQDPISAYRQGEFFDLCRGPHLPNLGLIRAFKILKTSGAYWRGDQQKEMLTRIYGISFPDRKLLKEYLQFLEEAKKRDHKILGPRLDLFSIREEAPGMPFIHPRGMIIWNELLAFWRALHSEAGYVEIKTPQLMSKELWERSGHWSHYRENMYTSMIDEREFAIKPMNCPGCMLYFRSSAHSYRDLPLRVAEIGRVHRHEASGALNGLSRVRTFDQDDAHIFMQSHSIKDEILSILKLADTIYSTFGLPYRIELSTRPQESIGTDEDWFIATDGLKTALEAWGEPYRVNEGDGAFYGPKIDLHVRDALGRSWQCATIQLDMALPEKFHLEYTDSDNSFKRPVMLHRALFGSIERFFGILIEHFAGRFPFWISPRQVILVPIADRHVEYAKKSQELIKKAGFLCDLDDSHESVGKKIRNAQMMQYNYMLTVGDAELERSTLSLRTRDNRVVGEVNLETFLEKCQIEKREKALNSPWK